MVGLLSIRVLVQRGKTALLSWTLDGITPAQRAGKLATAPATSARFTWQKHCRACSRLQWPRDYQFTTYGAMALARSGAAAIAAKTYCATIDTVKSSFSSTNGDGM